MAEETQIQPENALEGGRSMEAVYEIPVQVSTVLGKVSIPVNKLMTLERGVVVELDSKVGEPIEIYANQQLVARGELIMSDGRLGVTMAEIIKSNLRKP